MLAAGELRHHLAFFEVVEANGAGAVGARRKALGDARALRARSSHPLRLPWVCSTTVFSFCLFRGLQCVHQLGLFNQARVLHTMQGEPALDFRHFQSFQWYFLCSLTSRRRTCHAARAVVVVIAIGEQEKVRQLVNGCFGRGVVRRLMHARHDRAQKRFKELRRREHIVVVIIIVGSSSSSAAAEHIPE